MNDQQNTVVATVLAGLLLVTVFFCPWRVESSGEITWSPIYQPPISYVQSYDPRSNTGVSQMEYEGAEIAIDVLVVQVLLLGAAGGTLYVLVGDREEGSELKPRS